MQRDAYFTWSVGSSRGYITELKRGHTNIQRKVDKQNMSVRFSIITPTFEQVDYIKDTIESVLGQTFTDFEYIIVDSCSEDGTKEVVEKYAAADDRIKYIREKDHGQAEGINKGLRMAKGEIVAWLNSDDFYYNNRVLEHVDKSFRKYDKRVSGSESACGLVIGDAWYCDKNKKMTEYNPSDRHVKDDVIRRWYYIVQPACFWKNEGRLLDEKYHYVFDWKFFAEMCEKYKPLYTHKPYAVYRMYEDNKTGMNNAARRFEVYRLQKELEGDTLNTAWCRFVYKAYDKAEKSGNDRIKKYTDFLSKVLFHISGKRIAGF